MSLPLIGVTALHITSKSGVIYVSVADAYLEALIQAGACPIILPMHLTPEELENLHFRLDGVLFTGGGDIHPQTYGEEPNPAASEIDVDRDQAEFALLQMVLHHGIPFLGICRGIQVINVGLGGSLYVDIASQHPDALKHDYYPDYPRDHIAHTVHIHNLSRLHEILGASEVQVNSLHHQAIYRLAPGLLVTAHSPDGLVEGIELTDHPFGLAVQWHPEWLTAHQTMRNLFNAFVTASKMEKVR
jgi:putative glutamine amidotransferase